MSRAEWDTADPLMYSPRSQPSKQCDRRKSRHGKELEVAVPRILLAVPVLLLGMALPTAGAAIKKPPANVLGMTHEGFASKVVTVHRGDKLTMQNDSRFIHTVGAGKDGHLADKAGVPMTGPHLMETNNVYTTGAWNTPGTYTLTCSVHPEMTVKVLVTD
jgi:plastocyanin